jgi:hypothetical protein
MRVRSSVPNLSFGASVSANDASKAHQAHVSSLSRQTFACIRPVIRDSHRRRSPIVSVSCCLSAAGIRFLGLPVPAEEFCFSHDRPTRHRKALGPRRGFHVPHERDTGGFGCPLYSGATVLTQPTKQLRLPLPLLCDQPCTPVLLPSSRAPYNEASSGVHSRSPIHPSPRL